VAWRLAGAAADAHPPHAGDVPSHFGDHALADSFAAAHCDDFGYGRCALDILGDQITPETVALEIGPDSGALTFSPPTFSPT
jgi:hypothetical protein